MLAMSIKVSASKNMVSRQSERLEKYLILAHPGQKTSWVQLT
jgi:hypothetical protein